MCSSEELVQLFSYVLQLEAHCGCAGLISAASTTSDVSLTLTASPHHHWLHSQMWLWHWHQSPTHWLEGEAVRHSAAGLDTSCQSSGWSLAGLQALLDSDIALKSLFFMTQTEA